MNSIIGKIRRRIGAIIFSVILCVTLFGGISENLYAQPSSTFEPPHSDFGLDTDFDTLYDYLVVDVVVNISMSDYYEIDALIWDTFMNNMDSVYNYIFLDVGIQTVEIKFDGKLIYENGVDGPYTVGLSLFDATYMYLDSDTHVTAAYNWTDFQKSPGFEPPHTDYGLDMDSDGKYDYLVVGVVVYIADAGNYAIEGYLQDGFWNTIEWDYNFTFLEAGIQTVELKFYGISINNIEIGGPYTVDLQLIKPFFILIDSDTYVTSAYNWTDFQSGTHFEPPHTDHGLDTDSDGLYNYLVVEVVINVTRAGDYMIDAFLYDSLYGFLGKDYHLIFLNSGVQTAEFKFPGMPINSSGVNGPYLVELYLIDDTYNFIDSGTHMTAAYNWTDFQTPPKFEPTHTDYGLDTDSDTLFNYLVVDIVVNVSISDDYIIEAYLYDNSWNLIEYNYNHTFLNVGIQTVEFIFDGTLINLNGVNGSYIVDINIYDLHYAPLDSDSYMTSAYNWTDFDKPPEFEPPHADYGLDTDSDGLFNYLVIEAVVNLTSPGYYNIYSSLYDSDYGYISGDYNETFLDAGVQTVELRFSGMRINNCQSNGTYFVELDLYDSSGFIDSDTHETATYYWTDFQTGTKFKPPHTDRGVDNDSDGLYEYIIVEAVIDVSLACDYEIFAHMYDMYTNWIDYDYNYTFRNVGIQTVEFRFDGASINENGVGGPYEVDIYLLEGSTGISLDSDTHFTFAYNLTDFPDLTDPIADAGSDQSVNEDTNITFDGTGSKDNVGITEYTWSFVDDTLRVLYGANPVYNFTQPGIYLVTLNVTDAAGNWDTDTVNIIVIDITPPIADAGPDIYANVNTTKVLDGSRSTDNVEIINYTWTFVDGVLQTLYGMNPSYVFTTLGKYNLTLSVWDSAGYSDTDNLTVTAIVDIEPPIADAGADRTVDEDTIISFDGSGSTDNVDIVSYKWTFDDNGTQTLFGINPTYTFSTPGKYDITLIVTDVVNLSDSDIVVITVNDITPPTADAGSDITVKRGDLVTFDGSGSSDNVAIVNYTWTINIIGQTTFLYGSSPTHEFNDVGAHEVTLTVRDAANNTGSSTVIITVEDKARISFIEDYWWVILTLIMVVAILIAIYLLMKKGKGKEKQPVLIERQTSIPQEEIPPGPRS